jgi:hypothetical protein
MTLFHSLVGVIFTRPGDRGPSLRWREGVVLRWKVPGENAALNAPLQQACKELSRSF